MPVAPIKSSEVLQDVRYEIRGRLANHHALVAPGSSFNTPYTDHFRITTLPDTETLNIVFDRIDTCLAQYC
jgi:alanine-synthesizing transaminase